MDNIKIRKASTEVLEILNHLPNDLTDKVPDEFLKKLKLIAKKNYNFAIDEDKSLLENNISKDTINILIMLYRNFWCDEKEREELDKMLIENEKKYRNSNAIESNTQKMIVYKDSILNRMVEFIKNKFIRTRKHSSPY